MTFFTKYNRHLFIVIASLVLLVFASLYFYTNKKIKKAPEKADLVFILNSSGVTIIAYK